MTQVLNEDDSTLSASTNDVDLYGAARDEPDRPRDFTDLEKKEVEEETESLRDWVKELSGDDIKSGNWFSKLIAQALATYTKTATYEWFQEKYEGAPADVIVDQRIKMAARYAALECGASAAAYSAAVVATIGSAGGGGLTPDSSRCRHDIRHRPGLYDSAADPACVRHRRALSGPDRYR